MSLRRSLAALLLLAAVSPAAEARAQGAPTAGADAAALETFDAAWRIVRDSHFDPGMNGVDWEAVRTELRPRAAAARGISELREVIRVMLGRLGQSHFAIIPAGGVSPGALDLTGDTGIDVRLLGDALVVNAVEPASAAAEAGVRPGWSLVSLAGARTATLTADLPAEPRLRNVEAWRVAQERLRGPSGSRVSLSFEDGNGHLHDLTLVRKPETGEPVTVGHLPTMYVRVESERRRLADNLSAGVIRFNVWMTAVDREFQKAIDEHRDADGIVIDLRGNPGGLAAMLMGISGHFFAERKALGVMKTRADAELRFVANPRLVNGAGERVEPFAGPVAILVDALTGSASECFAGGMQGLGRARVFGQVSMGQALPALFSKLPNGDVLLHAYGDFVAADGTRLEGRGVVPDQIVPLTREALLAGEDAPLAEALRWIASQAKEAGRRTAPDGTRGR